ASHLARNSSGGSSCSTYRKSSSRTSNTSGATPMHSALLSHLSKSTTTRKLISSSRSGWCGHRSARATAEAGPERPADPMKDTEKVGHADPPQRLERCHHRGCRTEPAVTGLE